MNLYEILQESINENFINFNALIKEELNSRMLSEVVHPAILQARDELRRHKEKVIDSRLKLLNMKAPSDAKKADHIRTRKRKLQVQRQNLRRNISKGEV